MIMNRIKIRNKHCNYNFDFEFSNQIHYENEFKMEADELMFANIPFKEALERYPDLIYATHDDGPSSKENMYCLKIEHAEMFLIIYLLYDLTTEIPLFILNRRGMDNVENWIKDIYYLYAPFQFRKILNENKLNQFKTEITTHDISRRYVEDISFIQKKINGEIKAYHINKKGQISIVSA